jgi:hypothetical protein
MFLAGTVMTVVELLQWWKRQTQLYIKPPSRIFNLLSSISNSKAPTGREIRPREKVKQSAEVERGRSLNKAA